MKALLACTIAVAALAVTAVSTAGPSAQPQGPTANIAALERKLNRMDRQVKKLDGRVKKLERTQRLLVTVAVATLGGVACNAVITADAFQRTWAAVDEVALATQQKTYFGAHQPLTDHKSCSDLEIQRPLPPPTPATLRPFQEVVNLFYGP